MKIRAESRTINSELRQTICCTNTPNENDAKKGSGLPRQDQALGRGNVRSYGSNILILRGTKSPAVHSESICMSGLNLPDMGLKLNLM